MRRGGGLAERLLGVRRVPQIAFEIGDRRARDDAVVDIAGVEILGGAEEGVHGALAVRRHQHVAAPGGRAVRRRRSIEGDAGSPNIVGEYAAERIVLDPPDEGGPRAEARHADDGVGRRPAGNFHRRPHGIVDAAGARFVDERHRPFAHGMTEEEIILGAGDDIDNRIAEAENIVADGGHGISLPRTRPR